MKKKLLLVPALILAAIGTMNAQTYFSEDFEGTSGTSLPTGWTQLTSATDGGWKSGANTDLQSMYFPMPAHTRFLATNDDACNCDKSNDFLKTVSFDLSSATAPVATFDIIYVNASDPSTGLHEIGTVEASSDGGAHWTVLKTLGSYTSWTNVAVSLTAFAGPTMTNIMIGFRYNDNGLWGYGMTLDNVMVIEPPTREASVSNVILNKYVLAGNQTVKAVLNSFGGPTVTSADLHYSVDGGTPVDQTFSPNINYSDSYTASFTTPANLAAGLHVVKAWVTNINGSADATPENDSASFQVTVQATAPAKNVVVEEFTGAWCGYCPRGGLALSTITADPTVIGMAVHGGGTDNMQTTEGNTVINDYISGFPTGMVDRAFVPSQGDYAIDNSVWDAAVAERKTEVVPATVALSGVSIDGSRTITATVTATFAGDIKGAYSLNCYVVENNVVGPWTQTNDNGWNQHSYYYNDATSPFYHIGTVSSPWTTAVAGLMPSNYVHNHVVDKMMGGAYGDISAIPTTLVTAGSTKSKTFTYTLPAANPGGATRYNANNIHIVGVISEYDPSDKEKRYILNATEVKLNADAETTSIQDIEKGSSFGTVEVYPNPASTTATVALNLVNNESVLVTIYNALGQVVSTDNQNTLNAGDHLINLNVANLANGIYNVVVSTKNSSITKKISINK